MSYFPLDFLKQVGALEGKYQDVVNAVGSLLGIDISHVSEDEFMRVVLDPRFLNDDMQETFGKREGLLAEISDACSKNVGTLENLLGYNVGDLDTGYYTAGEWRELFTVQTLVDTWQKFKQVYRINSVLGTELCQSDDPKLSFNDLKALPYNSFYLDFDDLCIKELSGFRGCFVDVRDVSEDVIAISLVYVYGEGLYFSSYGILSNLTLKKDLAVGVKVLGDFESEANVVTSVLASKELRENDDRLRESVKGVKLNHKAVIDFVYQCLKYLVSYKPDVVESPVTAKTYRKSNVIKNKFSEIHMDDVGFVWGAEFSRRMSEYQRKASSYGSGKGSPKRPHSIRGHWHKHWVGSSNNRKLVVMWHEPTFTGGGTSNVEIHSVR